MKRSNAGQIKEDVNGNVEDSDRSPKKTKVDYRKEIASLMRSALSEVSKFHSNSSRGYEQKLDPLHKAVTLYERAAELAKSSSDQPGARKAFLHLGDTFALLADADTLKANSLENYKQSLSNYGKAFCFCHSLNPGGTASMVKGKVFKSIGQVADFVKTIDNDRTRNICMEQAVRCLEVSSGHWLEQVCLAKARLTQAEMLNDSAVVSISDKKFKEGIYLLSEMYRPMELTHEFIIKLTNNDKDKMTLKNMIADLAIIRSEYQTHTVMAQGLQALSMAGEVVDNALQGSEEMSVELVWEALDLYKQAALVSRDVEVEAHARGKMGLIYLNILKMEEIAKAYLSNSMDLAKTLSMENSVNLYSFSWYTEVAQAWNQLQEKVVKREEDLWTIEKEPLLKDKEVRRSLKLLDSMEIDNVEEFAEFLFDFFEPDHLKEKVTFEVYKKEAEAKGIMNDAKKMLLRLIIHWHPDKVSKETEENKKWYIICEEITKKLTAKYSLLKY